jgi:hypothetical protein
VQGVILGFLASEPCFQLVDQLSVLLSELLPSLSLLVGDEVALPLGFPPEGLHLSVVGIMTGSSAFRGHA